MASSASRQSATRPCGSRYFGCNDQRRMMWRLTIELSRVAKQRRLERFVGRQRYDSPEDSTSTRAPCPPKLQDPGAPAMSPPQELAEAPRRTAHGGTPTQPARRRPRHPPQARKGKSVSEAIRPRTTNGLPQETKMLHGRQPGSPRHQSADPCAVKRPTIELSRVAKQRRLERLVRPLARAWQPCTLELQ